MTNYITWISIYLNFAFHQYYSCVLFFCIKILLIFVFIITDYGCREANKKFFNEMKFSINTYSVYFALGKKNRIKWRKFIPSSNSLNPNAILPLLFLLLIMMMTMMMLSEKKWWRPNDPHFHFHFHSFIHTIVVLLSWWLFCLFSWNENSNEFNNLAFLLLRWILFGFWWWWCWWGLVWRKKRKWIWP